MLTIFFAPLPPLPLILQLSPWAGFAAIMHPRACTRTVFERHFQSSHLGFLMNWEATPRVDKTYMGLKHALCSRLFHGMLANVQRMLIVCKRHDNKGGVGAGSLCVLR